MYDQKKLQKISKQTMDLTMKEINEEFQAYTKLMETEELTTDQKLRLLAITQVQKNIIERQAHYESMAACDMEILVCFDVLGVDLDIKEAKLAEIQQ